MAFDLSIYKILKELVAQDGGEVCICKTCHQPYVRGHSSHASSEYCIEHAGVSKSYGNRHKYVAGMKDYYQKRKREGKI